jgi:hypothetical protein
VLDLFDARRARTDEAHVALDHVPQLRELVEAGLPEQRAELVDPRVALDLERRALDLVEMGELGLPLLGVRDHRAELVELEAPTVEPEARLDEQSRAGGGQPHRSGDPHEQGRADGQCDTSAHYIDRPLGHALKHAARKRTNRVSDVLESSSLIPPRPRVCSTGRTSRDNHLSIPDIARVPFWVEGTNAILTGARSILLLKNSCGSPSNAFAERPSVESWELKRSVSALRQ